MLLASRGSNYVMAQGMGHSKKEGEEEEEESRQSTSTVHCRRL